MGYIAVDLDGTLAQYDGWKGHDNIGEPIPKMVDRVKHWLNEGKIVKIFTARINSNQDKRSLEMARFWIEKWCIEHIGVKLEIIAEKDYDLEELWDDRAIQVFKNTGNTYYNRLESIRCSLEASEHPFYDGLKKLHDLSELSKK